MSKIILATAVTRNYLDVAMPYLNSITQQSNFDANVCVVIDGVVWTIILPKMNKLDWTHLAQEDVFAPNTNGCVQHGEFLRSSYFDDHVRDEDIIVFTDADIILQRPMSVVERKNLLKLDFMEVMIGDNEYATESLWDEARKIRYPRSVSSAKYFRFKDWSKMKIFNVGVVAATKSTWIELQRDYIRHWPIVDKLFVHPAKQQWLISWILQMGKYEIQRMPESMHSHGHRRKSPGGANYILPWDNSSNGILLVDGRVVLFNHRAWKGAFDKK